MRNAVLAAALAVLLSATGIAAVTTDRGVPHYPANPARAHTVLGQVSVLAVSPEDGAAASLADAARARYGDIDALAQVRTEPLPWSQGALVTGTAIRWN